MIELLDQPPVRLAELAPDVPAAVVQDLLAPGEVRFEVVAPPDRTGARPARVWQEEGATLQELLVMAGAARVWPEHDAVLAGRLQDLEDAARAARRGGWGDGRFSVVPAVPAPDLTGFAILRGTVVSTGRTERFAYVNFGRAYRSSTSIRIRTRDVRAWRLADHLPTLVGRTVEVRGVVFEDGGPMLELDHPQQLRVVD